MKLILILEDEYFLAEDCAQEVVRAGMHVLGPFHNRESALEALSSRHPDGAIIDVNLAGQSALIVAELLQSRGVPFAFYTGYDVTSLPGRFHGVPSVRKPSSPEIAVQKLVDCMK
jgi:DNA-binding NarL/FixJ family response regulator